MFERLTDRARTSIKLAQEGAIGLGHTYIGTEHLLLGLVTEGTGVAAVVLEPHGINEQIVRDAIVALVGESAPSTITPDEALASLGIDLAEVRRRIEESFGPGSLPSSTDHVPFTPRARDALERSVFESETLLHGYVGTEHILLALMADEGGLAHAILQARGINFDGLRAEILDLAAVDYLRIKATDARLARLQFLVIDARRYDVEGTFRGVAEARIKEVQARSAATKTFADEYEAAVAEAEAALASKGLVLRD